ncbi:hypothetical protein AVEN_216020-1 [Araneus ventricosus]|uniref:Uncharacterized protein n=1 Tax=Araneus ventricosus TaxID=182803 RepID=A0A4Y2IK50_ARAVE|nr:hypothetical protein AVEN_36530-1 [Araneus ventricosus]GBM77399.1 hypothetical protein AVEN_216020-1 [Araneus ventricosus]
MGRISARCCSERGRRQLGDWSLKGPLREREEMKGLPPIVRNFWGSSRIIRFRLIESLLYFTKLIPELSLYAHEHRNGSSPRNTLLLSALRITPKVKSIRSGDQGKLIRFGTVIKK